MLPLLLLSLFAAPPAGPKTKPAEKAALRTPAIGKVYTLTAAEREQRSKEYGNRLKKRLEESLAGPRNLTAKPLAILERISQTWQVRMIVDWEALREAGFDDEDEFTFNYLDNITLSSCLDDIVYEFGKRQNDEDRKPIWVLDLGAKAIRVSTRRAFRGLPKIVELRDDNREVPPFGERFAMDTYAESLELPAVPMKAAVEFLAAGFGVKSGIDWKALAAAGVNPNAPVNVKLEDPSLRAALDAIIDAAAGKLDPAKRPKFVVDEKKVIHVSMPGKKP